MNEYTWRAIDLIIAEGNRLRAVNADLLAALQALLPVAEMFEKQASKGSGSRRGGRVFEKARAAIAKAEAR